MTVFVTTHYLDEAEYCHRIMLMHAGAIVAGGRPRELKDRYALPTLEDVFIHLIGEGDKKRPPLGPGNK